MTRLRREISLPTALTIAGSDSGGGAGLQADLKTFAALKVHGTCVVTCVTAQNPAAVLALEPVSPRLLQRQLRAVFAELPPAAVKIGLLPTANLVRTVARFFAHHPVPIILDPVMVATSGRRLIEPTAFPALQKVLLPIATLVTPNLSEAEQLTGSPIRNLEALRCAARTIHSRYGCAALVKGGHLRGSAEAVDFFFDGRTELMLSAPFVRGVRTHGTGCTYSAAIAAGLARGLDLARSVGLAKTFVTRAIAGSARIGAHSVLTGY